MTHDELVTSLLCAGWKPMSPIEQSPRFFTADHASAPGAWITTDARRDFVALTPQGNKTTKRIPRKNVQPVHPKSYVSDPVMVLSKGPDGPVLFVPIIH